MAGGNASACVERATSDGLIGPDWAINMELCDIINVDPRQAKDALKTLKKRLGNKNPKIQLLALFVLDAISKNCGEHVFQLIVERDILHDMVKMVKKKPDLSVREKILTLIDAWQEAFEGPRGMHPQYYAAYNELRAAGVEFPPREDNNILLFTPPQTQPTIHHDTDYEDAVIQASLQTDASGLSLPEIQNAQELADVLMEMLGALDTKRPEALKEEVIVDLVDQCHSYRKRVMLLVNETPDEELLCKGLALNDSLQRVLDRHDEISRGISVTTTAAIPVTQSAPSASVPTLHVDHEDDDSDDDFTQLAYRSRDNGHGRKQEHRKSDSSDESPILPPPPPPFLKKPVSGNSDPVDYLRGDAFRNESSRNKSGPSPFLGPDRSVSSYSPSSLPATNRSMESPTLYSGKPVYDAPVVPSGQSVERLPAVPWDNPAIPPPPSRYNQRQQFFEQHHGNSNSSSGSGSSHDSVVGQTQNLSLNPTAQSKQEDALFKDLVDFAKAKSSSSSSSSKPNRSF
ncbi:hypothetical protein MLD38_034054 [Melastoma candidum]|uniref:Uncharacterized protein n=1 Tax=Melastoma candidum TaxID=119954 RepID=A0ACB9M8Q7_9MYRT|nr:hypothetical protein MLD38_034054 [Melastoma candidum]